MVGLGRERQKPSPRIIAIGASTGGTEALTTLMSSLRPPLPPIVIVQHIPPVFSELFSRRLDMCSQLSVKEAAEGDRLLPSHAYVAKGDIHLEIAVGTYGPYLHLSMAERVNWVRPSADVLFFTVAHIYGQDALGVILTGMGADGAKGLLKMKECGAYVLGQDEASCVVYGMPRAAYEIGAVDEQLPLSAMGSRIMSLARGW